MIARSACEILMLIQSSEYTINAAGDMHAQPGEGGGGGNSVRAHANGVDKQKQGE